MYDNNKFLLSPLMKPSALCYFNNNYVAYENNTRIKQFKHVLHWSVDSGRFSLQSRIMWWRGGHYFMVLKNKFKILKL